MLRSLRPALLAPAALALSALLSPSHAAVVYDESIDGDLSTNYASPTLVSVQAGSNHVLGTTGRVASVVDRDYFTIVIPTGLTLSGLEVLSNTTGDGSGSLVSFVSVQSGAAGTNPATAQAPLAATLLGYYQFGPADIGQDILDDMALSNSSFVAAQGFTAPLPAGTYTFWTQETVNTVNYGFNLKVTSAVPEPAGMLMSLFGAAALFAFRPAKRRTQG